MTNLFTNKKSIIEVKDMTRSETASLWEWVRGPWEAQNNGKKQDYGVEATGEYNTTLMGPACARYAIIQFLIAPKTLIRFYKATQFHSMEFFVICQSKDCRSFLNSGSFKICNKSVK